MSGNGHNGFFGNLWPGHFCPDCGGSVKPGAIYEEATIAPEPGKKGNPILLHSLNAQLAHDHPEDPSRVGWCFRCDKWVRTVRKSVLDVRFEYAKRQGVSFRFNDAIVEATNEKRQQRIANMIELKADERRMGSGVVMRSKRVKR